MRTFTLPVVVALLLAGSPLAVAQTSPRSLRRSLKRVPQFEVFRWSTLKS